MLLQAHRGDPRALARYVASADDASSPALLRWWAAHCEAQRRFAEAKAAYRRAGAWSDLVRLTCFEGVSPSRWCGDEGETRVVPFTD